MAIGASRLHHGLVDTLATDQQHRRMTVYGQDASIGMDTNIHGAGNRTATTGRLLSHVESFT